MAQLWQVIGFVLIFLFGGICGYCLRCIVNDTWEDMVRDLERDHRTSVDWYEADTLRGRIADLQHEKSVLCDMIQNISEGKTPTFADVLEHENHYYILHDMAHETTANSDEIKATFVRKLNDPREKKDELHKHSGRFPWGD